MWLVSAAGISMNLERLVLYVQNDVDIKLKP